MSNSISRHSRRTTPWDAVENKSPTQLNTTGEEILINSYKPNS